MGFTMSDRVVVVGAGIVGLWAAYELQRRGMEVVVVDKGELGSGSSFGNAGWVIPARTLPMPAPGLHWEGLKMMVQPDSPLYIKPTALPRLTGWFTQFLRHCNAEAYRRGCEAMASLSGQAFKGYDGLVEDGLEFEMHERGLLSVYLSEEVFDTGYEDHKTMAELGLGEPQRMSAAEVKEMQPELGPDVVGGVFIKEARHIDPGTVLAALAGRLRESGATLRFGTEVTGFERRGERIVGVKTKGETIAGDHVVVAAGAWAGPMLRPLGYSLPLQAGKGYSLSFRAPNPSVESALFLGDAKIAVTPLNTGTRYAGTIEFSGLNAHLERPRIDSLHKWIPQYLPNYDGGLAVSEWVGMRPVTPDGLPAIGRMPGYDNAYVALGHSTAGLPLAPATAWRIADLVEGVIGEGVSGAAPAAGGAPAAGSAPAPGVASATAGAPGPDPFDPARFG